MKRKSVFLFLSLWGSLVCCPVGLWAGKMEPVNFRYSAVLKGEIKKGAFYRMTLPAEVLERCEGACKDIRLFDKEDREIPVVLLDNRIPAKKIERYPLEVISYDDETERTKIVLKRTGSIVPVNRIELESPDRDFHKTIAVSGSADSKNWKSLGQEAIYDFSSRVNLRKTHVTLSENAYPFLQLTIDEGKEEKDLKNIRLTYDGIDFSASTYTKKKLKITRFIVLDDAQSQEKVIYDELKLRPSVSTDDEKRVTEILFHTALPFSALEFAIDHPYYYRPLKLYGKDPIRKEEFLMIRQDALYRFPISNQTETKKRIDLPAPHEYRSYKIVIENGANPPLAIESMTLKWPQKQLFFIGLDDHQEYRLCWGSPTLEEVNYDITKVIRPDNWFTQPAEPVQIAAITQNMAYRPYKTKEDKTLIEKNVLVMVVIFVVVVVAFLLFQLWKKTV